MARRRTRVGFRRSIGTGSVLLFPHGFPHGIEKARTARVLPEKESPGFTGLSSLRRAPWKSMDGYLAPEAGFEPATRRLTVACSTAELLRNEIGRGERHGPREGAVFWQSVPGHARPATVNRARDHGAGIWRPGPESNRHTRICSPLHHHSATRPLYDRSGGCYTQDDCGGSTVLSRGGKPPRPAASLVL